jgi:hypothetical protein
MEDRFIKLKSGAVYHYCEALAKRKDALVVDGHVAAMYFRKLGIENAITRKYPMRAIDKNAIPERPTRPARDQSKRGRPRKSMVVSDDEQTPATALEELLEDNANKDV